MRVLVTAVGGDVGQGAVAVLRRRFPDWTILGSDTRVRHAGPYLVDEFLVAPSASSAAYPGWIQQACVSGRIDLLLPCSDAEIRALTDSPDPLPTAVVMANRRAVEVGQDKLATAGFLAQHGIPGPRTVLIEDADAMSYPCIIKPRRGQGSRGVHLCASADEARALARFLAEPILQEALGPAEEEITCGVYRTRDGQTAVVQLRRELAGGATAWAEVIADDQVLAYCVQIAEALSLTGAVNLQLIRTTAGPRLFEINPRFSSTVAMRDALGFTDLVWAVQEVLLDERPRIVVPDPGRVVYRLTSVGLADG